MKSMDDMPDVEHTFDYRVRLAEALVPCDDLLPLHPDFHAHVQHDERGYFIADKAGNRWEVRYCDLSAK